MAPGSRAAATSRSFSARDQRRRRSTDVITSTCVLVIGLSLGIVLSLPLQHLSVKAAVTGRIRDERSRPLIVELERWLREQRARVSKNGDTGKAIDYSLKRWDALTRFLDDGRVCLSNNAAERELRAVAVGRRNWTFAGSDEGGRRAAAIYTLIATAKLNGVDPQAWLADVLARLPDHPMRRLDELLPWNWRPKILTAHAA